MRPRTWLLGVAVVIVIGGYALRDEGSPRPAHAPQLSVAGRGFALHDPGAGRARLVATDGGVRQEIVLRDLPGEARVVGASGGLLAVWREGERIHAAGVKRDGGRGKPQIFGKHAVALCDGVASNARRVSVGWRERDGTVWFVFGPTSPANELEIVQVARPQTTWCTLAVSGEKTVLLWRSDAALYIAACGKQCPGLPPQVRGDAARRPVLGFGCAGDGCALATRDPRGELHLTWTTTRGRSTWDRALPGYRGGAVDVIGAGDRQVAVAYEDRDGHPVVVRASTRGDVAPLWRGERGTAPSLAWIDGVLAVAYRRGDQVVTATVALPR